MSVSFPDVANFGAAPAEMPLARVGMANIEVPLRIDHPEFGQHLVMGRADAYVSLDDPKAKGIHMSRLFLQIGEQIAAKTLSRTVIEDCLSGFVASHENLAKSAFLNLRFELPLLRAALKSDHRGWRAYPIEIKARFENGQPQITFCLQIAYSSTCPCSAALARQLVQKRFTSVFGDQKSVETAAIADWLTREDAVLATPHGQRSQANLELVLGQNEELPDTVALIDAVEAALGTPVQAAVKREDEQEFARLNGANLMFAEDAARKAATAVQGNPAIVDFRIEVLHFESLHPHDATAVAVKGIEGGLRV